MCVGQSDVAVLRHGPVEQPHRQLWKMTMLTSPPRRYDGKASPTTTTSFPPIPPKFCIVTELLEVVRCRRSQQRSPPSIIAQDKRSHARLHLQWRSADGRMGRCRHIVNNVRYSKGSFGKLTITTAAMASTAALDATRTGCWQCWGGGGGGKGWQRGGVTWRG